jgi:hypothetical protein
VLSVGTTTSIGRSAHFRYAGRAGSFYLLFNKSD